MVLYQLGVCLLQWMLLIIIATHVHYVWVQVSEQLLWVTNRALRNCSNKKLIQNTYHAFFVKQFCMSTAFHLAWPVCASFDHISLSLVLSYTFCLFNLLMSWSVLFQLLKDDKGRPLTLKIHDLCTHIWGTIEPRVICLKPHVQQLLTVPAELWTVVDQAALLPHYRTRVPLNWARQDPSSQLPFLLVSASHG